MTHRGILGLNLGGTIVFALSAAWATAVFEGFAKVQGVVVALALFALGVVFFLGGYWRALQRSRAEVLSVTELYFLVGPTSDRRIARIMNALLVVQVLIGVTTALIRSSTPAVEGTSTPGSTLAFGVLVPVFGLGLNGWWSSRHGRFPARQIPGAS